MLSFPLRLPTLFSCFFFVVVVSIFLFFFLNRGNCYFFVFCVSALKQIKQRAFILKKITLFVVLI